MLSPFADSYLPATICKRAFFCPHLIAPPTFFSTNSRIFHNLPEGRRDKNRHAMQDQTVKPSYYAIIPASVRYDSTIPDGAKLLYGEITALCDKEGYCWASNAYFSGLYGKSTDTISRWISDLSKHGYIYTLVDNAAGNSRKIWLAEAVERAGKNTDPIRKNADRVSAKIRRPYPQKPVDPIRKNAEHNNTVNTTMNGGEENAPAPTIPETLETEKILSNGGPRWRDYPKAQTPDELLAELQAIYKNNREQWRATIDGTPAAKWSQAKTAEVVSRFCAWAIGEGWERRTFGQINARLKIWFTDEPRMGAKATPTPQATPQGPAYQPFNH